MAVHLSLIPSSDETTIAKYTRLRSHRTSLILREAPVFTSAASKNSGGTPLADSPPFGVAPPYPAKLQGDKNRQHPVARFSKPQLRICLIRLFVMLASGQILNPSDFGFHLRLAVRFTKPQKLLLYIRTNDIEPLIRLISAILLKCGYPVGTKQRITRLVL